MNKVLKKALGFAGALGLTAVMVLAAAPVQASDVDARIQVLERELAQLKQNEESESALAAEMKAPAVKYTAGKGLTIAAADNAWSLNIGMVYRIFSTFYLTHDDDTAGAGTGNGVIHVVRHRPDISVTSGGGFYRLYSQWKVKDVQWRRLRPVSQLREYESVAPERRYRLQPQFRWSQNAGFHWASGRLASAGCAQLGWLAGPFHRSGVVRPSGDGRRETDASQHGNWTRE